MGFSPRRLNHFQVIRECIIYELVNIVVLLTKSEAIH